MEMTIAQGIGFILSLVGTFFVFMFAVEWRSHGLAEAVKAVGFVLGFMFLAGGVIAGWLWVWGVFA